MSKSKTLRFIGAAAAVGVLAFAAISAGPALAGKGGVKGSGQTVASVLVAPSPVPSESYYTVTGSGFTANQVIHVSSTCGSSFNLVADSAGNMTDVGWAGTPKTCTFWYSQFNGNRLNLMATLTLEIV